MKKSRPIEGNFLIAEFTGLGNFIQKTPLIRCIKETNSDAKVLLIGDNRWGGLDAVRDSELVDEICEVPSLLNFEHGKEVDIQKFVKQYNKLTKKQEQLLCEWLVRAKWDYFLQSDADGIPASVYSLINKSDTGKIVRHLQFDQYWGKKLLQRRKITKEYGKNVIAVPYFKGHHEIDTNLDLFQATVPQPIDRKYDCFVSIKASEDVKEKWNLEEKSYICFQPGAASGVGTPKIWRTENFAKLGARISDDLGKTVVLIGDEGDNKNIISTFAWPENVVNTAGRTSLCDLVGLLLGASVTIVHDSGIMHIANALNVPLIALYGPTDFSRTQPLGESSKVLFSKTEYAGIMFNSLVSEKRLSEQIPYGKAMEGISVEDVYSAVENLLSLGDSAGL